jgi:hypothetical protein
MLNVGIKIEVSDQLHSPAAVAPMIKPRVPTVPGPEPVWTPEIDWNGTCIKLNILYGNIYPVQSKLSAEISVNLSLTNEQISTLKT